MKEAAGTRFDEIELNALIGFVMITDDAAGVAGAMAPHFGISPDDALHIPLALLGTLDEMIEELQWRREEYGHLLLVHRGGQLGGPGAGGLRSCRAPDHHRWPASLQAAGRLELIAYVEEVVLQLVLGMDGHPLQ